MNQLTPTQNVEIDLIITAFDKYDKVVKFYAPKNTEAKEARALPGVLLESGESVANAVKRTIKTKTSLKLSTKNYTIQELPAQTVPNRDPRGHVLAIPVLLLTKLTYEDLNDEEWVSFNQGIPLAYDHTRMIDLAFELIVKNLKENPIPLLMLDGLVTLEEVKNIIVHFDGSYKDMYLSNFKKVYPTSKFLEETDKIPEIRRKGRQFKLYLVIEKNIKNFF